MRSPSWVRTRPPSSALAQASWHSPALPALSFQKLPHEWTQVLSLVAFKTWLLWPQSYFVYLSFQSYLKIIYSMVLYFFGGVKYNNGGKIRFGNDIETRSFTFETLQPLSLYGNHDCNQFCVLRYVSKMKILTMFSLWMNSCLVTPTIIAIVTTQFTTTSQLHSVERKLTTAPGHPSVGENIMCNNVTCTSSIP